MRLAAAPLKRSTDWVLQLINIVFLCLLFFSFIEDHQVGIGFLHDTCSGRLQDLLPVGGLHGTAMHPP